LVEAEKTSKISLKKNLLELIIIKGSSWKNFLVEFSGLLFFLSRIIPLFK